VDIPIACPSSRATDSTTILLHCCASATADRVGHDQLIQRRLLDALDRRARQHAVHRAREHALGAGVLQRGRRLLDRAGGVDDVVLQDARPPLTSPITFITSAVPSSVRRLSTTASSASSRFAYARAARRRRHRRHDRQVRVMQPRAVFDDDTPLSVSTQEIPQSNIPL
jgi:hypothetical protein